MQVLVFGKHALHPCHRYRWQGSDVSGHRQGRLHRLPLVHQAVETTQLIKALGAEGLPHQHHLSSGRAANQTH
ncbi:hypothetical protein D3C81_2017760 [compost metagenome]